MLNLAGMDGDDVSELEDFADDLRSGSYEAAYTFIEPSYDVVKIAAVSGQDGYYDGNSQHPQGSVFAGEAFIKKVYETIRNSERWNDSLLIVTWDEHGGFFDHCRPPRAIPTGSTGENNGFLFDHYGPRVPAIIISPRIPRNLIDHTVYDHTSVLATLARIFNLPMLSPRMAQASDVKHLVSLTVPRIDTPTTLPDPVNGAVWTEERRRPPAPPDPTPIDPSSDMYQFLLHSTVAAHLKADPAAKATIAARVASIKTRGDFNAYRAEVAARIDLRRKSLPHWIGRGASAASTKVGALLER